MIWGNSRSLCLISTALVSAACGPVITGPVPHSSCQSSHRPGEAILRFLLKFIALTKTILHHIMCTKAGEGIDLVYESNSDMDLETSLRVTIAENLPHLSPEKWYESGWLEEEEKSETASGKFYSLPSSPKSGINSAEGRWEFIMDKLINIENNTTSLRMDFSALSDKVDSQSTQLLQVQDSVADLSEKVGSHSTQLLQVKSSLASNDIKIAQINERQQSEMAEFDQQMGHKFRTMESSLKMENERFQQALLNETKQQIKGSIRDEMLQEQCSHRKLNLIFVGLAENENKTDLDIVKTFLSKNMSISDVDLISAYRLGKSPGSKPRPILARFVHMGHRNRVWFSKAAIKQDEAKVWLQEDLPRVVKHSYRALFKVLKKAKSMGDRFPGAQIMGQSIIIDGRSYKVEDLESLPDVLRPSNMAMQQSDNTLVFFGRASPLSNHHFSPFIIEDIPFQCMEQYLAWRRAKLADRQDLIDKALLKADPLVYKSILNDLHSVKADEWNEDLLDTALVGLRAKFRQNPPRPTSSLTPTPRDWEKPLQTNAGGWGSP